MVNLHHLLEQITETKFFIMTYKKLTDEEYIDLISKQTTSTNCYYDNNRDVIMVLFCSDIKLSVFDSFPVKYHKKFEFDKKIIQIRTTRKAKKMFDKVKVDIRKSVQTLVKQYPLAQIEIVGSKFGSMLAQLAVQDLYKNYLFRSHLITIDTIKTFYGNEDLKTHLKTCCKGTCHYIESSPVKHYPFFPGYFYI